MRIWGGLKGYGGIEGIWGYWTWGYGDMGGIERMQGDVRGWGGMGRIEGMGGDMGVWGRGEYEGD